MDPHVASFIALRDQTIDTDSNGRPDRLEFQAQLQVVEPGEYSIRFTISGPDGTSLMVDRSSLLRGVGRQTLKASIGAAELFDRLRDGPYTLTAIQIGRVDRNYSDSVQGVPALFTTTTAYRRSDWDRGKFYAEETIAVNPIRRSNSGKYRSIEIAWTAATNGGECTWTGEVEWASVAGFSGSIRQSGKTPPGLRRFAVIFDARGFATSAAGKGLFHGLVECENNEALRMSAELTLDLAKFESASSPLHRHAWNVIEAVAGAARFDDQTLLLVDGRADGAIDTVRIVDQPEGLNARIETQKHESLAQVEFSYSVAVAPGAAFPPGRYFVTVEASARGLTGTAEVIVIVVPPIPKPPLDPSRQYLSGPVTFVGIRPDSAGKFRFLQLSWPVETPGGQCGWGGTLQREGSGAIQTSVDRALPKGKAQLSIVLSASVIADSGLGDWTFDGYASCKNPKGADDSREFGPVTQKLDLNPAVFAKSTGVRAVASPTVQLRAGQTGVATVFGLAGVPTGVPKGAARFKLAEIPAGFRGTVEEEGEWPFAKLRVAVGKTVKPGRYFLGFTATVGGLQGQGDVVVEVLPATNPR